MMMLSRAAADVLGDTEKTPARIFLEREHKGLAFNLYFFRP